MTCDQQTTALRDNTRNMYSSRTKTLSNGKKQNDSWNCVVKRKNKSCNSIRSKQYSALFVFNRRLSKHGTSEVFFLFCFVFRLSSLLYWWGQNVNLFTFFYLFCDLFGRHFRCHWYLLYTYICPRNIEYVIVLLYLISSLSFNFMSRSSPFLKDCDPRTEINWLPLPNIYRTDFGMPRIILHEASKKRNIRQAISLEIDAAYTTKLCIL